MECAGSKEGDVELTMPRRTSDMPKRVITELAPEQEAAIDIYREKWKALNTATEAIDWEKAALAIKTAYALSDFPEPEILCYGNPLTALEQIFSIDNFKEYIGRSISTRFSNRVRKHLEHGIGRQLEKWLHIRLGNRIRCPEPPHYWTESHPVVSAFVYGVSSCTARQLMVDLNRPEFELIDTSILWEMTVFSEWTIWGCMTDFCISELGLQHDKQKWKVMQDLMQHCGFLFMFENVCLSCDRPVKILVDQNNHLHAEGEPALLFADGYEVYANHARHPSELEFD